MAARSRATHPELVYLKTLLVVIAVLSAAVAPKMSRYVIPQLDQYTESSKPCEIARTRAGLCSRATPNRTAAAAAPWLSSTP
jgi:hypothetical protein